MSETAPPSQETELSPIDKINAYLTILEGTDPKAYKQAAGSLDYVFFSEPVTNNSVGVDVSHRDHWTTEAAYRLEQLQTSGDPNHEYGAQRARQYAAVNVVRSMVQGDQISREDFWLIIDRVSSTVAVINNSSGEAAAKLVRQELSDLWFRRDGGNPYSARRIAEAYKWVDGPRNRKFGRMMRKVAGLERAAL